MNDFQKKVFAEYKTVKALKESSDKLNNDREKQNKGCLFSPVFIFIDWFISKILENERRKKNYAGNEQEARELLRQKEVSDKICGIITKINGNEILTEAKFVNEFTAALYQSDLASRFVIPENVVLYAMMAMEIFNIGLENFCNGKNGDE